MFDYKHPLTWLGVLSFAITFLVLKSIHLAEKPSYLAQQEQIWRAPNNTSGTALSVVHSRHGATFASIEKLLRSNYQIGIDELKLDHALLKSLRKCTALLDKPSNDELIRLHLVTTRAFPGPQGDALAETLVEYLLYHHRLDLSFESPEKAIDDRLRQIHYFGPMKSAKLFAYQNSMGKYLNARRDILNDKTLGAAEKGRKLKTLQAAMELNAKKLKN